MSCQLLTTKKLFQSYLIISILYQINKRINGTITESYYNRNFVKHAIKICWITQIKHKDKYLFANPTQDEAYAN